MRRLGILAVFAVVTLGGLLLPDAVAMAAPRAQRTGDARRADVPVEGTPAASPAPVSTPGYAERESAAQNLESFKGGGAGIYIGGSTVAVVLIIVLIIIIL